MKKVALILCIFLFKLSFAQSTYFDPNGGYLQPPITPYSNSSTTNPNSLPSLSDVGSTALEAGSAGTGAYLGGKIGSRVGSAFGAFGTLFFDLYLKV